jgi:hypothetical protein
MFGCDYSIGREPKHLYNDRLGNPAPKPSAVKGIYYDPTVVECLGDLSLALAYALRISASSYFYEASSYDESISLSENRARSFVNSWSENTATLPNGRHELNEEWSDCRDPVAAYSWVMYPELRGNLRQDFWNETVNKLRFLQEEYYPSLSLEKLYPWPYFRGEVMIAYGLCKFTSDQVGEKVSQPVAYSYYQTRDRHNALSSSSAAVDSPMVDWRCMIPSEYNWLLSLRWHAATIGHTIALFWMETFSNELRCGCGAHCLISIKRGYLLKSFLSFEILPAIKRMGYNSKKKIKGDLRKRSPLSFFYKI